MKVLKTGSQQIRSENNFKLSCLDKVQDCRPTPLGKYNHAGSCLIVQFFLEQLLAHSSNKNSEKHLEWSTLLKWSTAFIR